MTDRLHELRDLRSRLTRRQMPAGMVADLDRTINQLIAECRRNGVTHVEVPGEGVLVLGGPRDVWYPTRADT